MFRTYIASSLLQSVGYDAGSGILEIEFKKGGIWLFFDIPPKLHQKLINAESPGRFFTKYIKGSYLESRLEES